MRLEPKILAILLLVAVLFVSGCAQSKPATQQEAAPSLDSETDSISSEISDFEASATDLTPQDFDIEVIVE